MCFRKKLWTVLFSVFVMATHAGVYQGCKNKSNEVPCSSRGWTVGGEALYIKNVSQSLTSDLYDRADREPLTVLTPSLGWGFLIDAGFNFGTGTDFIVTWSDYDKTDTSVAGETYTVRPRHGGNTFNVVAGDALRMTSKFDVVNFDFGQQLFFGESIFLRPHAGVQYAHLEETMGNTVTDLARGASFLETDTDGYKNNGWGIRAGLDGKYQFDNGFAIYSTNGIGLVWFREKDIRSRGSLRDGLRRVRSDVAVRDRLSQEIDLNIGAQYTHSIAEGNLTAKVGYYNLFYNGRDYWAWSGLNFGLHWSGDA